jgi:mono/diheme cytochrome c family protein
VKAKAQLRFGLWAKLLVGLLVGLLVAALIWFAHAITIELIAKNLINTTAVSQNGSKTAHLANPPTGSAQIERGAYLAKLGNCAACHTARGGEPYAGGKAIHTPFGAVYASNITPHAEHGLGRYSSEAFYRAMTRGIAASGQLLTPAFPYPNFKHITRADSDDLYAYFMQAVPAAAQANKAHELAWPLNSQLGTQLGLAVWRVLFFDAEATPITTKNIANYVINTPASSQNSLENVKSADDQTVERGRYLVQGLGHCSACHAQRNALGAARSEALFSGSLMPLQDWYAPSLHAKAEAGVQHWPREQIVALLQSGNSQAMNASALGPMAEVVAKSTQHWSAADLAATAAYLQSLPVHAAVPAGQPVRNKILLERGAALYTQHCATCHGTEGQGQEQGQEQGQGLGAQARSTSVATSVAIPALAGNRALSMQSSANLVRIILAGGYAPATAGNPQPYGMPPFVHVLTDEDIAALSTYIRASWGNTADGVSAAQVVTQRKGVLR